MNRSQKKKNQIINSKIEQRDWVRVQGVVYKNNKKYKVVIENKKPELETANWLANELGEKVFINPRVDYPLNIKTADFMFRNKKWELKTSARTSDFIIIDKIKQGNGQAQNFIVDIRKSNVTSDSVLKQIESIYSDKGLNWVNHIIVRFNNGYKIFKR